MKILVNADLKDHTLQQFSAMEDIELITDTQDPRVEEAEVLIGNHNADLIKRMPALRMVQLLSAGSGDLSDIPGSVPVANAYGAYGAAIAEYLLGATLMIQKNFPLCMEKQKEHIWDRDIPMKLCRDMKVLSVGMGSIGTGYLRLCSMLGMECCGVRRTVHDKPDFVKEIFTMETMDTYLSQADIVALSMPHTAETAGMFNEERLRKMKKDSILLNVGRGSAIVGDDLIKVVQDGWFRGVVLDVTEQEPLPKNSPLWNTERVYITPHISGRWNSGANYESVMQVVKDNLSRFLRNEPPVHIVDRKLGY